MGVAEIIKKALSGRADTTIDAPVEDVFGCVARLEFLDPQSGSTRTSEGPVGLGTEFSLATPPTAQGSRVAVRQEVTEFVPNSRLAYQGTLLGLVGDIIRPQIEEQYSAATTNWPTEERWSMGGKRALWADA